ncbi:MAG: NAD(P)-binding domain-containing protein [Verrucomicrobiota bacterium]
MKVLERYYHWLHGRWPAGRVEKLPEVREDGTTNVPGIRVVGDLTGIPLLKFSLDTGAKAIRAILTEPDFQKTPEGERNGVLDVAIIGAGVSGMSAAVEAQKAGLHYKIFEAAEPFSTIANFPKGKPIYTYPTDMTPEGDLQVSAGVKEALIDELERQRKDAGVKLTEARIDRVKRKGKELNLHLAGKSEEMIKAKRVVVAIGRSGNFRKLDVPGENLDKVYNRLHDPKDFCGKSILVVGGGDSALETAIALGACGSKVMVSYRKKEFARPKPDNIEKLKMLAADPEAEVAVEEPTSERVTTAANSKMRGDKPAGSVKLLMASKLKSISEGQVELELEDGSIETYENDAVFSMIGREAPLGFFRKCGVNITGERTKLWWISLVSVLCAFTFVYQWKKGGTWLPINEKFSELGVFPFGLDKIWESLGGSFADPSTVLGTLKFTVGDPGFYYSLLYCAVMCIFGVRRILRRKTPYVKVQTITLWTVQFVPLFLLPYLVLPWMGFNGLFDAGFGKWFADEFFPIVNYGSGREYWRAFGLILAWPLFFWNVFTDQPMWGWLALSFVQTFVIIPLIIWKWGKGAYCSWICSCGGMAETLGDAHRHKMPHGPFWNKLNMVGQVFLWAAFAILLVRIMGWFFPGSFFESIYKFGLYGSGGGTAMPWGYVWFVDLLWAGIIGFGLYFHFSGRVWCRFACPLAALMHIYARFSQFRIFPDKSKCISCNVCTSVCHQGIDIMNFANKGIPMEDPECVRCSACVQGCPTGVLSFGRQKADGNIVLDTLPASLVQMAEKKKRSASL